MSERENEQGKSSRLSTISELASSQGKEGSPKNAKDDQAEHIASIFRQYQELSLVATQMRGLDSLLVLIDVVGAQDQYVHDQLQEVLALKSLLPPRVTLTRSRRPYSVKSHRFRWLARTEEPMDQQYEQDLLALPSPTPYWMQYLVSSRG